MSEAINRLGDAKNFVSLGYTHSALMAIDDVIKILQAAQAQAVTKDTRPQPAQVNQQLLEALVNTQAIIEMLYPEINRPDALNLQIIRNKAAIAAAQEVGK
jgi:hypothetical protein